MADDASDWQSPIHRANIVASIEEAVRRAGNPQLVKSPADMENAIFMQCKTKDDYKAKITKVIMHLQEASNRVGNQFGGGHAAARVVSQTIPQPAQMIPAQHVLPTPQAVGVPGTMPRQPMIISQMVRQPFSSPVPTSVSLYTMASMADVSRVSPAPGVAAPMPSPGSGVQIIPQRLNAPSPGNAIMPTSTSAVDPSTVQPSASPAVQSSSASADEDRLYAEKLSELQVYVDPLRGMLNKLSEQPERQKDLAKLTSLLKILTSTNRTTLTNLSKCEGVLKKMNILPPTQANKMSQQHANAAPAVGAPAAAAVAAAAAAAAAAASSSWTPTTTLTSAANTVSATAANAAGSSTAGLQGAPGAASTGAGSVPSSAAASALASSALAGAASTPSTAPAVATATATAGVNAAVALQQQQQQQAQSEQHWCQPLLNAVAESIKSPMFNEALQLTFGPVVTALRGVVNRRSSPLQNQANENNSVYRVPRVVQGELARLQPRFRVRLDHAYHGSDFAQQLKTIHLTCSLEDENLPAVPHLRFMLPDGYPLCNPSVDIESLEVYYGSSPFFKDVKQRLLSNLSALQGNYSMTALLHAWCISIRQAIRPVE